MWRLKTLFSEFNLILKAKRRTPGGERKIPPEIMTPLRLRITLEQSTHYSEAEVEKALLKLQEADIKLKTSQGEPEAILIELVDSIVGEDR